jgi:hypothetical protein
VNQLASGATYNAIGFCMTMSQSHLDAPSASATFIFIVFLAACLLSSLHLVLHTPKPSELHQDDVAKRSDQRFSALRAELPAHGVIGYIGESAGTAIPDYYLAQYALAPLVLDHSINHKLVVGNFTTASKLPRELALVKNFGNGVLLLENKDVR